MGLCGGTAFEEVTVGMGVLLDDTTSTRLGIIPLDTALLKPSSPVGPREVSPLRPVIALIPKLCTSDCAAIPRGMSPEKPFDTEG